MPDVYRKIEERWILGGDEREVGRDPKHQEEGGKESRKAHIIGRANINVTNQKQGCRGARRGVP